MYDENSNVMALVSNLINVKDSRWLQLEVCREYQRGQCSRTENECKFAHPAPYVEVQNGRVTACYDSIKGRCQRENPKCKYLHPPQHLKDQLLINGKNNLALRNMLMTQLNPLSAQPSPAAPQLISPLAMTPNGNTYATLPGLTAYPYGYTLASNASLYPGLMATASPESLQVGGMLTAGSPGTPSAVAVSAGGSAVTPGGVSASIPSAATVNQFAITAQAQAKAAALSVAGPNDRIELKDISYMTAGDKAAATAAALGQSGYLEYYALPPQAVKRPALEKSGVPVYQPVNPTGAASGSPTVSLPSQLSYTQLAGAQGLPASYVPTAAISSLYQYPLYTSDEQKVARHQANLRF